MSRPQSSRLPVQWPLAALCCAFILVGPLCLLLPDIEQEGPRLEWLALLALAAPPEVVWPLSGSLAMDAVADPYGPRLLDGAYDFHRGIDIKAPTGTPIHAIRGGCVVRVEVAQPGDTLERFGRFVVLRHDGIEGFAKFQSVYLHTSAVYVRVGDCVRAGQTIAAVGRSGAGINTDHLHLECYAENDGSISRLKTRSCMRLLPYALRPPQLALMRTAGDLALDVRQDASAIDLTRFEFVAPGAGAVTLDFEARTGMNSADDDSNPFSDFELAPDNYNELDAQYRLRIRCVDCFPGATDVVVRTFSARGAIHEIKL